MKPLTRTRMIINVCALAACFICGAEAQEYGREDQEAEDVPARPEYRQRSLPADTFTPSEEISEDFPVPFPVDI